MAGIYNINLEQNGTYQETILWKDGSGTAVDLTDFTPSMQIRDDSGNILVDVADAGDIVILDPATDGKVQITIPPEVTAEATWRSGKYDLFLTNTNVDPTYSKKLLKGVVSIEPSETE